MTPGPTLRRAALTDAPAIADLSGALGYPATAATIADRLEQILGREDQAVLVVADATGAVVAWTHIAEDAPLEYGPRCEILGLVVGAAARRQGAGRALVAGVEAWARGRGLTELSVRSNVLRMESHPFYEGLGFVRIKTQHAYRKAVSATDAP